MEIRLDGRSALVTGGSRGIGLAIATALARAGARVMLSSRKPEALAAAAAGIVDALGPTAYEAVATHAAHAGDPQAARDCVAATVDTFGGLDILVNNAATNPYFGRLIDIDLPRYDKTHEVNQRGPLIWTQAAWRQVFSPEAGGSGGVVLNISSIGGLTFSGPLGAYDMTKAALIHQTKHLAGELAPTVRVNAIAPGLVKTDFAKALWQGAAEDAEYPWPLRRLGLPEDIANAAVFLVSDQASWITGEVLVVDGGAMTGGGLPA
jgi:NAD(P)-dependent dehydrogenase (short-subunit alcohol dehydrogenase family)